MIICIRFRNLNMSCLYQEKAQKLRFLQKRSKNVILRQKYLRKWSFLKKMAQIEHLRNNKITMMEHFGLKSPIFEF